MKYLVKFTFLLISVTLFSCWSDNTEDILDDNSDSQVSLPEEDNDLIENSVFSSVVEIKFGSSVGIVNPHSSSSVSVTTSGNNVIVKSTIKEVEYIISGETSNGSLTIYSDYKFKLTLDGVDITSSEGPAINIQSKKRIFVVVNNNTVNKLTDSNNYTSSSEDKKATFFSEGQLIFYGNGKLNITAKYKHALASDDYIRFKDADLTVSATVSDAIHANDAIIIEDGTFNLTSSSDGIQCDKGYIMIGGGTININCADDGICISTDAATADGYISILGGVINITTTGTSAKGVKAMGNLYYNDASIYIKTSRSGSEGMESKNIMTIDGGEIEIEAYDDCLNASKAIIINGGNIYCYSSSNDGIDSNGTLTITGGIIVSIGTTTPEEGFDCDNNMFKITGGTLVGLGGSSSSPTTSVCTQPTIWYSGSCTTNNIINISTSTGATVCSFVVPRTLNQMSFLYSSADLYTNNSYIINTGGKISGGESFHGLYSGETYSGGTQAYSFTINSMLTKVGTSTGGGGNPGGGGGRPW